MKQVLVNFNKTYLFPLPKTYYSFVNTISNKTKIQKDLFIFQYKGNTINNNNFHNINENLNIIDVSLKLNGGVSFPNFTSFVISNITQVGITSFITTMIIIITLLKIEYSIASPEKRKNGLIPLFNYIQYIPTSKNVNIYVELFLIGIVYYTYSFIPSLIILLLKSYQCPGYKVPFKTILVPVAIPFILLLVLCFIQKRSKNGYGSVPTLLYFIIGCIFLICGVVIGYVSNNSLRKFEDDNAVTDMYKIPIISTGIFIVLRRLLIIGNKNGYSSFKSIMLMGIILFFVSIASSPSYADLYMRSISSPFTECPQ